MSIYKNKLIVNNNKKKNLIIEKKSKMLKNLIFMYFSYLRKTLKLNLKLN